MRSDIQVKLDGYYVAVKGQRCCYVVSNVPVNPQPPVVLVHGIGLSHRYLLPLAVRLADDCKVYVPDQLGFGCIRPFLLEERESGSRTPVPTSVVVSSPWSGGPVVVPLD